MGVKKGLSIDGINYFSDIVSGKKAPNWLGFSKQVAKVTGNYTLLNLTTSIKGLQNFLFKTPNWLIGGIAVDGIMHTEHTSKVRATEYPVQSGANMADHAIIEPAQLSIDIMMTDANSTSFTTNNPVIDRIYNALKTINTFSNYMPMEKTIPSGDGRSAKTWTILKAMQLSRVPITVETRLQTYQNMIIEELSAPDDVKTLYALKASLRLKEIIIADVARTVVSARKQLAQTTNSGQLPVQDATNNKTALNAMGVKT